MDEHGVADEVCELVGAASLLAWLELPDDVDGRRAIEALHERRRKLQALQGSAKHRHVARLVIQRYRALQRVLERPADYMEALRRRRALAQLPLLDIGVDGVLADGAVTDSELAFLRDTARRLGLDPEVALGRLHARAKVQGVPVATSPRLPRVAGAAHPLLPRGWFDEAVAGWLSARLEQDVRTVVEPAADEGSVAVALLQRRPHLTYLGFSPDEARVDRAQQAYDLRGLAHASALPSRASALPVSDGVADAAVFVLHPPTADELAEAWRVVGPDGQVLVVSVGAPRVTLGGSLPALDEALGELVRAAGLETSCRLPAASVCTHVVTRTVGGPVDELVALLLQRVAAVAAHAGLSDDHPAVYGMGQALGALQGEPGALGCYQVPLEARGLTS